MRVAGKRPPVTEEPSGETATHPDDAADTGLHRNQGPYALSGPIERPATGTVPLRGDLAHIGLAGRHFVPHYAVPQPRTVLPGGAPLLLQPDAQAEELCTLMEGDSFEVLEVGQVWAWGCLSLDGPVGYVRLDHLELLS